MALTAAEVYRDYPTDGVPSSGVHEPKKSEIRTLLGQYEQIVTAFTSNGGLIYSSKASMDADLAHAANSMAWVVGDASAANNGIYQKQGASGAGSWTRVADLPYSFIVASDVGDGTPNAIVATSSLPISGSALVLLNVYETNTGSPVTVSFNGGSPLTIKTNSGNDLVAGGLVSGMLVVGRVSDSTFRLVSDQASAAVLAQAEAILDQVEIVRDEVLGAVPNVFSPAKTAIKALDTTTKTAAFLTQVGDEGQFTWRSGDYSGLVAGDPGEDQYIPSGADPDGGTGAWVRTIDTKGIRYWLGHINLFDYMTREQIAGFKSRTFVPGGRDSLQAAINALPSTGGRLYVPEPGKIWMDEKNPIEIEARGIGPNNIRIIDRNDWEFDGSGMTITTSDGANNTSIFFLHRCAGFEFKNVSGLANNTGLTPGVPSESNGMLFVYSARDFHVKGIKTSGFIGSTMVGNFQFRGVYEDIEQDVPNYASGFDTASWQDMTVIRHRVRGSGAVSQGFQHIYDAPNSANQHPEFNETGIALRENRSNNIRYIDPDVRGCQTGVKFADAGGDIFIRGGRIYENSGASGDYWFGLLFQSTTAGVADGGGISVNLNIDGTDIYSNGRSGETSGLNGGVAVNSSFSEMQVHIHPGTKIHDNATAGIVNFGASMVRANDVDFASRFGALQTVPIRNPEQLKKPSTSIPAVSASKITSCRGINPAGFSAPIHTAPAVPVGTGVANRRVNTNPYPCIVYINGGSGAHLKDANTGFEAALGGDPKMVILQPGDAIYFMTSVPTAWGWYGM